MANTVSQFTLPLLEEKRGTIAGGRLYLVREQGGGAKEAAVKGVTGVPQGLPWHSLNEEFSQESHVVAGT